MISLLCHFVGDFWFQSDWMALNKSKRTVPCLIHVLLYTLPFLLLTQSWTALAVICGTHFLIDRFGLPKYLIFVHNFLAPRAEWKTWEQCKGNFGFSPDRPFVITFWLSVVFDNSLHLLINSLALKFL